MSERSSMSAERNPLTGTLSYRVTVCEADYLRHPLQVQAVLDAMHDCWAALREATVEELASRD